MEEAMKLKLSEAGVDMEKTLARFLNKEDFYQKFLLKFPSDPNFEALEKAIAEKDMEGIERAAHTLKGVSANLGLDPAAAVFNEMVWAVRNGESGKLDGQYQRMKEQCRIFQDIIDQIG